MLKRLGEKNTFEQDIKTTDEGVPLRKIHKY